MKLEALTSEEFDGITDRICQDMQDAEADLELKACSSVAEESRVCGIICRDAEKLMKASLKQGKSVRNVFAAVFATSVRYGWHLHRLQAEIAQLASILPAEEIEQIRREIEEQTK